MTARLRMYPLTLVLLVKFVGLGWPSFFARRRATLQQTRKGLSMIEFELVIFNRISLLGKAVEV